MARYPDIRLQLELRNDAVDLVAEGFDLAIRIGPLEDSSCAVRYLAESRLALYASPDYLARAGMPATLDEVARRPTLTLSRLGRHGCFTGRWPGKTAKRANWPSPRNWWPTTPA